MLLCFELSLVIRQLVKSDKQDIIAFVFHIICFLHEDPDNVDDEETEFKDFRKERPEGWSARQKY